MKLSGIYRRDSFITHRAFCDALAEESMRTMAANPLLSHHQLLFSQPPPPPSLDEALPVQLQAQFPHLIRAAVTEAGGSGNNSRLIASQRLQELVTLKREPQPPEFNLRSEIPPWLGYHGTVAPSLNHLDLPPSLFSSRIDQDYSQENNIPHHMISPSQPKMPTAAPHMSATALLQKAAQMGATMSRPTASLQSPMAGHSSSNNSADAMSVHGSNSQQSPLLMIKPMPQSSGFDHASLEEGRSGGAGGNEGLTRDFLGLRAFSHRELFDMAGLETCISAPFEQPSEKPWLGN